MADCYEDTSRTYKYIQRQNLLLSIVYGLSGLISVILSYQLPTQYFPLTNSKTFFNNGTFTFEPIFNVLQFYAPGRYIWILFLISCFLQLAQASDICTEWVIAMIGNNVNYFIWIDVLFSAAFVQYEIATRLGVTAVSDIWYQALLFIGVGFFLILVEIAQDESVHYRNKDIEEVRVKDKDRKDKVFSLNDWKSPPINFMAPFLMSGLLFLATWFTLFGTVNASFSELETSLQFTSLFIFFLELCYPLFIVMRYYNISWFKNYVYSYTTFSLLALLIKFIIGWVPLSADVKMGS